VVEGVVVEGVVEGMVVEKTSGPAPGRTDNGDDGDGRAATAKAPRTP
jgi:hypothetical protein